MFTYLEEILLSFAHTLPLEMFVLVASVVEEVVAPIPSPTVMVTAGSFALIQDYTYSALVLLALIGAVGKTIGALVVYSITDKAEDVIMGKFGRFFNITHEDVEKFGKRLHGGVRDYFILTLLRALPFIPSVLISVGSGLIKVPLPVFITATFLGTILRDGFYLYAGYVGAEILTTLVSTSTHIESYVEYVVGGVILLGILYFFFKKTRRN